MGDKAQKQPPHRVENGRKVYTVNTTINSFSRDAPPPSHRVAAAHSSKPPEEESEESAKHAGGGEPPGRNEGAQTDLVRVPFRLISAVRVWPTMGWLGPQLVDYGHNDGAAIRQIPEICAKRRRSVPLTWDHSNSSKDRAGKVENIVWEDSKDIPPGVNGDAVVNKRFDEKAAVGLETGELEASSICVQLDMEWSHPDMEFMDFIALQGREVDGEIVRWLPIAALDVLHHALVWAGADPNSGPRETESENGATANAATTNTASAVQNTHDGGEDMEKVLALLTACCAALGIDVVLAKDSVPDKLQERMEAKLTALKEAQGKYNELASGLQGLENRVKQDGDTSLSSADVLNRLPARLDLAVAGEQYIADLRAEALKWFDSAKVDPQKPEISAEAKAIRDVIAACGAIGQLKAYCAEYKAQAEKRFGPTGMRSSEGSEPPTQQKPAATGADLDIIEGAGKLNAFSRKGDRK